VKVEQDEKQLGNWKDPIENWQLIELFEEFESDEPCCKSEEEKIRWIEAEPAKVTLKRWDEIVENIRDKEKCLKEESQNNEYQVLLWG
jgi:hypothetical protein